MKRRVRVILVFLLLGAIINIAVAWACSWREYDVIRVVGDRGGWRFPDDRAAAWWKRHAPDRTDEQPHGVIRYPVHLGLTMECGAIHPSQDKPRTDPGLEVMVVLAGWPMHSLRAQGSGIPHSIQPPAVVGAIDRTDYGVDTSFRWLPLIPRPLGFVVDTAFWALVLWPVMLIPRTIRRRARRRRGLCRTCGYDLRHADHVACPECGTPISAPRACV